MLKRTVFVTCINDLTGAGAAAGAAPARIDLSWSNQANSTSYRVLRGTVSGGPYSTVVGTTNKTSISDTSGLTNGDTYYYVVQPINGGAEVCQSNQATVKVPVPGSGRK
jgi:fibronectin type 3 domain-containing protein